MEFLGLGNSSEFVVPYSEFGQELIEGSVGQFALFVQYVVLCVHVSDVLFSCCVSGKIDESNWYVASW